MWVRLCQLSVGLITGVFLFIWVVPAAWGEFSDGSNRVDAKMEAVWPHKTKGGGAPVGEAEEVNISAYIFKKDTLLKMPRTFSLAHRVKLWKAVDNGVEELVGEVTPYYLGKPLTPPAAPDLWIINDIDVRIARNPEHRIFFRLSVDGYPYSSNVWAHAVDGRTFNPQPATPTSLGSVPAEADAHIVIVYPKDGVPITEARSANIRVLLFEKGTTKSVPASWDPALVIQQAKNTGMLSTVMSGGQPVRAQKITLTSPDGLFTYPAWDFNDVPVEEARDPQNKYYFRAGVEGTPTRSNIWAHGADGRTHYPQADIPQGVAEWAE